MTRFALLPAVLLACSFLLPNGALADSATWNTIPNDNQWNKPRNWTPATVPYGIHDVATFGASNVTDIMLGLTPHGDAGNRLSSVVFNPGASSYTITMTSVYGLTSFLEFHDGIVNNSGVTQNFVAAKSEISDSARIYFEGVSSAGQNVVITNQASVGVQYGAFTSFDASSTAGSATLVNEGADVSGTLWGGFTDLLFYSNADSATFISNPGTVSGAAAGHTLVQIYAPGSVGDSTFISNGANVAGAEGGWTEIDGTISAGATYVANGATVVDAQGGQVYTYGGDGYSYFIANGGDGTNAPGGLIDIAYVPASTETMVTANGGTDGGLGGIILIEGSADIPLPQFQVFGNGTLDLSNASGTVAIGSLSGNGLVLLDGHSLSAGNNNLDTTFSGAVEQGGTLIKDGTGTLTLSGANTQSGGTTINAGVLIAGTRNGSATGTGNVNVKAGTLGGNGAIAGAVTVGTGSGTGAFLEPSVGASKPAKLTIQSPLSFRADGTYTCKLNTKKAKADQLSANGVTIDSGAQFNFQPVANKKLTTGTVFSAINNTSATPISGTFANLPDGSTFTVGRNNYQVSYEGGDGNDLTLTVVP